jgi:signal transduction histidine kinase
LNLNLRKKVLGLVLLATVASATVITVVSGVNVVSRGHERMARYRETLMAEKRQQLRSVVEMASNQVEKQAPDQAKKLVLNMRYGDKGYVFLQDYENHFLAHPDPELDGKDGSEVRDANGTPIIREFTRIAKTQGEGYLTYPWKILGQDRPRQKISYVLAIPERNWVLVSGIYIDDIDREADLEAGRVQHELSLSLAEDVGLCVLVTALLYLIATRIVRTQITGPIEAITEDLYKHADTIAGTVAMQSTAAAELSSSVAEIASTMEELSSSATQVAQHSQTVVGRADQTLEDTRHGAHEVETLNGKIEDISRDIQTNIAEIVDLGRKSKEITKIMEMINNIANQTKLIAFNAALEAASAGEAGKRFGVVAVEIRRLADGVVASTGEIEGRITEILDSVNRLVMSSEKTTSRILEGQTYAGNTVAMLEGMVEGVEASTESARQISLSTQQQQIASSQVVIAIKDIEQAVRHSTDSVQQLNRVMGDLTELSRKLQRHVATTAPQEGPGKEGR